MIRKFRSIEEMNAAQAPELETDPDRLFERVTALFEMMRALPGGRFRGVHKFRNIEESNQFRLEWMRARVERMRDTP